MLIATGVYSRTEPHVPIFPGAEDFVKAGGEIVHSVNFNGDRDYSGQHVVTVGYGKSAFDSSLVAKKDYGAKSSTILFREAHWPIPRKILGLIPFEYATFSRIGCALLNPEYQVGSISVGTRRGCGGLLDVFQFRGPRLSVKEIHNWCCGSISSRK